MGVITPDTGEPNGATCASKLASARPRRLSGSQKMAGRSPGLPTPGNPPERPCVSLAGEPATVLEPIVGLSFTGAQDSTMFAGVCAGLVCPPTGTGLTCWAVRATGAAVMQLLGIVGVPPPYCTSPLALAPALMAPKP